MVLGVIPSQISTISLVSQETVQVSFTFLFSTEHSPLHISTCTKHTLSSFFYLFLSFPTSKFLFQHCIGKNIRQIICQVYHLILNCYPRIALYRTYKHIFAIWTKLIAEPPLADYPLVTWPPLQNSYSKGNRITSRVTGRAHIPLVVWWPNKFILLRKRRKMVTV